jgi:uncharacterized protein YecT (DUF1311 family)
MTNGLVAKKIGPMSSCEVALAVFCLIVSPPVVAAEHRPDCAKVLDLTPMEQGVCMRQAYEEADRELNRVYGQVIKNIRRYSVTTEHGDAWEKSIREAQRAWVRFKELDCNVVEHEWFGGTGMGAAKWDCLRRVTRARIEELGHRYN